MRHAFLRHRRPVLQVSRGRTFRSGGWTTLALAALALFAAAARLWP